jgi:hypothetical protein
VSINLDESLEFGGTLVDDLDVCKMEASSPRRNPTA